MWNHPGRFLQVWHCTKYVSLCSKSTNTLLKLPWLIWVAPKNHPTLFWHIFGWFSIFLRLPHRLALFFVHLKLHLYVLLFKSMCLLASFVCFAYKFHLIPLYSISCTLCTLCSTNHQCRTKHTHTKSTHLIHFIMFPKWFDHVIIGHLWIYESPAPSHIID